MSWFTPESPEDKEAYYVELTNFYKEKYKDQNRLLVSNATPLIPSPTPLITGSNPIPSQAQRPASNSISIPKLKVQAPIIVSATTDEAQVLKYLRSGVVLYPGSVLPGQSGTSVIIGHSSTRYPWEFGSVFAGLNKLNPGDLVYINYNGQDYTYTIKDKRLGSGEKLSSMHFDNDLILASCWPIGTDNARIVVTADLDGASVRSPTSNSLTLR